MFIHQVLEADCIVYVLNESRRQPVESRRAAEKCTDYCPTVAIIATNIGIGDNACLEIIRIFPRKIQGGRKCVGNVASRADSTTDYHFIRFP